MCHIHITERMCGWVADNAKSSLKFARFWTRKKNYAIFIKFTRPDILCAIFHFYDKLITEFCTLFYNLIQVYTVHKHTGNKTTPEITSMPYLLKGCPVMLIFTKSLCFVKSQYMCHVKSNRCPCFLSCIFMIF